MRKALIAILLIFTAFSASAFADQVKDHKAFSLGLLGGYTALPSALYSVDWVYYGDRKYDLPAKDDSYLNAAPMAGLAFTYLPSDRYINLGFTLEGFFLHQEGKLKGKFSENPVRPEYYEFHQAINFYQLNFLGSLYFTKKDFKPYIQLGLGAVRADTEIESYHQTQYGGSFVLALGGQYSFASWFALGGQVRLTDLFSLVYVYEPDADNQLTIEAQYIPISLLLHTTFYF